MIEIGLEDAYAEACRALGESVVRERLLTRLLSESASREQIDSAEG